jgi:UDP-N-acetylmuramate dehydrogenase
MTGPLPLEACLGELVTLFGSGRVGRDVALAPFTTFRVGGPADVLVEPRSAGELVSALESARRHGVPVTMLGGGSNVLIADEGVRGLVLRPRGGDIAEEGTGRVRADASITINGLVRWTIGRGLAGLESWAGTPGTVGGGVYGNAHWGGRLLSEMLLSLRLWTPGAGVADVPASEMEFGYDRSRLQRTREVLVSALFVVEPGDPAGLRAVARESLAYRKRTQPLDAASAGCIFQNPSPEDPVPPGLPRSAGALIDRAGLKGARVGGAQVSPTHGNFIVNARGASARDVRQLIEQCRAAVRAQFGVVLRDEIVYLGVTGTPPEEARVHAAD